MSDVYVSPPAAPPPPPPRPPQAGYDFLRPFAFVFDDPRWLSKIGLGGLFVLLGFIVVGIPFLFGYAARLIRNVIAGVPQPLPEWDDLGEFFGEGLILFCVGLIYFLPVSILSIASGIGSTIVSAADQPALRDIGGGIFGCASCVISFVSLAVSLVFPAALLMVITTRRFGAAFDFNAIFAFIRANAANYIIATLIEIVAWIFSYTGLVLFCVGIVFTQFWALVASSYAFAQVWRQSTTPATVVTA